MSLRPEPWVRAESECDVLRTKLEEAERRTVAIVEAGSLLASEYKALNVKFEAAKKRLGEAREIIERCYTEADYGVAYTPAVEWLAEKD